MKKFLLAGVAAIALASGAQAADLGVRRGAVAEAIIAPVFGWTGFYVGAQVGYGWGRNTRTTAGGAFTNVYNSNGLLGGVHLGYNYQINMLVVGVVADIEAAGLTGNDGGAGGTVDRARVNWQGSLRARAGIAVDRALFYVTGGLAVGGLNYSNDIAAAATFNTTRVGWTLGGGVEYAFTPNWTAHVEYRYTDFGTTNSPGFPGAFQGLGGFSTRTTTHTVRLGVSYLFSTGGSAVVARY